MKQTLGELIRELRTRRGWTQEQAANAAQVSRRSFTRWERNQAAPRVPELETTLTALGATPSERRRILTLLDAPRAIVVLRAEGEKSDWGAMPMRGDLLRAMRLRRGRTLDDVAHEMGISAGVISRWEHSEMWPETARLAQLCYVLGASCEEWLALSRGRAAQLSIGFATPEELRFHAVRFSFAPHQPEHIALMDLNFHALAAALWPLAQERASLRILLGQVHTTYADFLLGQNRYHECERIGTLVQDFLHGNKSVEPDFTLAALRVAEAQRLTGGRRGAQRAERILRDTLPFTRDPFRKVWILTLLGQTLAALGHCEEAQPLAQEALAILEPQADVWQRREGLDQVINLLSDAGCPGEALHVTERFNAIRQMHPSDALRMATIMRQLSAPEEARYWLGRAYAVLENPLYTMSDNVAYVPTFRKRADEIAAQL